MPRRGRGWTSLRKSILTLAFIYVPTSFRDDDVSYVSVASNEDEDEDYQEEIQAVEQAIKKVNGGRKPVARKAATPESPKIR